MTERTHCSCYDIDIETFRAACAAGAHSVKTCFKHIGCLPKCNNCIPMVRRVLDESRASGAPGAGPGGRDSAAPQTATFQTRTIP